MSGQKKFSKKYISLIILLIMGFVWFYIIPTYDEMSFQKKRADSYREYAANNSPKEKQNASNGTLNIYTNNEYGFTFGYPLNWKVMDHVKDGPIVTVAPMDHVFKDGTETPYGFFSVWNYNKNQDFGKVDTDWEENAFIGPTRQVYLPDSDLKIVLIVPYGYTESDIDQILNTFQLID